MSSLDILFATIAKSGWRVNNLYQSGDTGLWRVSLSRPDPEAGGSHFGDWAEGAELADALEDAIGKMADAEFAFSEPVSFSKAKELPREGKSLLEALGLGKPKTTLTDRRF